MSFVLPGGILWAHMSLCAVLLNPGLAAWCNTVLSSLSSDPTDLGRVVMSLLEVWFAEVCDRCSFGAPQHF